MRCVVVVVLLFAFASACPKPCTKIYKPVCGNNGITYGNKCMFENAKCKAGNAGKYWKILHAGLCKETKCAKPCLKIYQPVCGSNGITYGNKCAFENAKCKAGNAGKYWKILHTGSCNKPECPKPCLKIYQPVCGSNGITYGNKCAFENAKCKAGNAGKYWKILHAGSCKGPKCPKPCTKISMPVCGSNGITYGNKCMFENAKCKAGNAGKYWKILHSGSCKGPKCPKYCPYIYKPVCGSNGITYSSECSFNVAKCRVGADWTIAYEGRCEKIPTKCLDACYMLYDPVCGSNGTTYSNKCTFGVAKCRAGYAGRTWTIAYEGRCGSISKM